MAARDNKTGVLLLGGVVLAWLFWPKKAGAFDATKNLSGVKVDRTHSWEGSTEDWAKTRFGAALVAAKQNGETDDAKARQIALSMLTHWSIETAAGAYEWNFNVGNITATDAQPYYIAKDISGNVLAFRAFDSMTDGVNAYVQLLRNPRYRDAAFQLANNPEDSAWYIALGKAGWFDPTKAKPASTWDKAAADYASRRALLAQYASV